MRLTGVVAWCFAPFLSACAADPPGLNERDAVISIRNAQVAYDQLSRYVMVDQLDELCAQEEDRTQPRPTAGAAGSPHDDCSWVDHDEDVELLARIERRLTDLGFVRVASTEAETADFVVSAGIVAGTQWDLSVPFCMENALTEGCFRAPTETRIVLPQGSLIIHWLPTGAPSAEPVMSYFAAAIDKRAASGRTWGLGRSEDGMGGAGQDSEGLQSWLLGIDVAHEQASYLEAPR